MAWYTLNMIDAGSARAAEVLIFDEIGGWGITAREFRRDVSAMLNDGATSVEVHLNSPGGSVWEAVAILNYLNALAVPVTVYVDGYAASAASLIALAGRLVMPKNTYLMIHEPSLVAWGTAGELAKASDFLSRISNMIAEMYADKSRKSLGKAAASVDVFKATMAEEVWLSAADAKTLGLADEVTEAIKLAAIVKASHFASLPADLAAVANDPAPELAADDPAPELAADDPAPELAADDPAPELAADDPAPELAADDQLRAELLAKWGFVLDDNGIEICPRTILSLKPADGLDIAKREIEVPRVRRGAHGKGYQRGVLNTPKKRI